MTGAEIEAMRAWHAERSREWDGVCKRCGHDFFNDCHGDCTCLSCNGQRQMYEEQMEQ